MSHTQFNRDTRIELAVLLNARKSQTDCASILGMHRTNICGEINRNKDPDGIYRGGHAHKRALARRKAAKKKFRKIENDSDLQKYILAKTRKYWSPEQISGRLKKLCRGFAIISHEPIYQYIYNERPDLIKYLRHQKCKYRKKRGSRARIELARAIKVKRIEMRPEVVNERSRIGDWENDTVIGKEKNQRALTYVERKSGYGVANKLDVVTAEIVHQKEVEMFKNIPKEKRLTVTRDNGSEFGDYDSTLERKTGMDVYRANAYHSWERGSNENWNGLFRQFFPKGMYFATVTQYQIDKAVKLLNDRPRKRLNYSTPREVFKGCSDSS
ncbi:MAG: IS30 family transposase [Candidatus Paceibacterota bacterium]|jgi:IS30 family transposase